MPDALWNTVAALGSALYDSPVIRRVCEPVRQSNIEVPRLNYQELDGTSLLLLLFHQYMRTQPLLMGVRLVAAGAYELGQPQSARAWLDDAVTVGTTFQAMIELLRSRLPGYPMLHVPHLCTGSPRRMDPYEFTGFPWDPEQRDAQLQRNSPPELDALGGDYCACAELLLDTARHLQERLAWRRLAAARDELSDADVRTLIELNNQFAARLRPHEVDARIRPGEQHTYAEAVLNELIVTSEGAVGEYLAAFEVVDQLITVVAAYLQGFAFKGKIPVIEPRRMDLGPDADLRPVEVADDGIPSTYGPEGVFYVRGPLPELSGVVYPLEIDVDEFRLMAENDKLEEYPATRAFEIVRGKLATGSG